MMSVGEWCFSTTTSSHFLLFFWTLAEVSFYCDLFFAYVYLYAPVCCSVCYFGHFIHCSVYQSHHTPPFLHFHFWHFKGKQINFKVWGTSASFKRWASTVWPCMDIRNRRALTQAWTPTRACMRVSDYKSMLWKLSVLWFDRSCWVWLATF